MSAPPQLSPEVTERMAQLSVQYKDPIRQVISHTEELILQVCNELIHSKATLGINVKKYTEEIVRLRKLCDDNKIVHAKPVPVKEAPVIPPQPNRAERRAVQKKKNSK